MAASINANKLKGAVIGFGRMGLTHFSILNNHPEVKFVAVTDPSQFVLKNIREYMGLETFKDYRKMIDNVDLDFVIVSTPTRAHAENVKYAIEKGLHVFVEKPFALNPKHGHEIIKALEGKKLVNQVGYVVRFSDVFINVKEHIEENLIGDPISFKMEMYGPTVLKESKGSWRSKKTEGGGCLYDFASHPIDLINYIFGLPTNVFGSELKKIYSSNVEDAVSTAFSYENGLSGTLLANWSDPSYRKPAYRLEILGRKGKIVADLHTYKVFLSEKSQCGTFERGWNNRYIPDFAKPVRFFVRGFEFTRQLDYFIECILNNATENICCFADGLATDKIIYQIAQDAALRRI